MANSLYGPWRLLQLGGTVTDLVASDLNADDIQARLQDADYVRDLDAHADLVDIGSSGNMTGGGNADMGATTLSAPAATTGVVTFDAPDTTFTSVTGAAATQIVIFNNTGAADANRALIANFDTATGLPVTPNGGNIVVQWNASGIFTW
jgi:hypothetical protein